MDIKLLKNELLHKIQRIDQVQIIHSILDYTDYIEQKYHIDSEEDELTEDDIQSINEAEQEYKEGKCVSLDEYMKQ